MRWYDKYKKRRYGVWLLWTALLLTAFLFVSCAGAFQSKIYMDSTDSLSTSLSAFFQKEKTEEALGVPSEMQVSKGRFANKIEVSWSAVNNANAYRLERAVVTETDKDGNPVLPKEEAFKTLNATDIYYKTAYTDIILADDETYTSQKFNNFYFYRVCALKTGLETDEGDFFPDYNSEKGDSSAGDGGGNSEVKAAAALAGEAASCFGYLFKSPASIEADKGKSTEGIQISWSKVDGAVKYEIHRCETANGYYYTIATVWGNETSHYDEIAEKYQGSEFYYKVSAINSNGQSSVDSAVAMGYTLQQGAPTAPDNVRIKDGLGTSSVSLVVEWDPVDVSNIKGENATYSLYRNTSTDSTYNLIKSNIQPDVKSYEDKGVSPGVYYYYYLQTIAEKKGDEKTKIKSAFSDSGKDSKSPAYGFLVAPPASIEVDDGSSDSTVVLRWSPALNVLYETDTEVAYTYNIYCDQDQNGTFTTKVSAATPTENSDGKLQVELDKQNFFMIKTVTPHNVESSRSEIAAPVPIAPTNITVSKTIGYESASKCASGYGLTLPEEQWVANANGVYPVVVTWSAPNDKGVAGYNVYRSTSASSGFKKVNDSMIMQTCYVDNNSTAKSGLFYYYKVASLNVLGQGTKTNDPSKGDAEHKQRGYGALTLDAWYGEYNENIARSQSKLTLMHKSNNLDKVGSETKEGDVSGTLSYTAKVQGLGAEITMPYTNYMDYFIGDDAALGVEFVLNGNTNTTSNMSANGNMHGTVNCYGYYLNLKGSVPGTLFDKISAENKQKILNTEDTHYIVGMYPGRVKYNNLEVKGGKAGGGYYLVETYELDGGTSSSFSSKVINPEGKVDWTWGEKTFKYHNATVNFH